MELYGNQEYVFESKYRFEQILTKLRNYAGSVDVQSGYKLASGVEVGNMVIEKFSFRNGNFMIIVINVVDDGAEPAKVFLTIKERQEGLINFSFGKKEKIKNEIINLLT